MHIVRKAYLDGVARGLLRASRRILSRWIDHRIAEGYFCAYAVRKLHIGCGNHILDGWLNADRFPRAAIVFHLDAAQPFPFGDDEFDFIFCEHVIEHMSFSQGLGMLSECYRVLRPQGKIRISTPDLRFLLDLYKEERSSLQDEYIQWATRRFIRYAPFSAAIFVINNFMRDWGHQFIYDDKILWASLERAGFERITRCELQESEEEALRNLENESRMPKGFLRLETICVEGTKLKIARP